MEEIESQFEYSPLTVIQAAKANVRNFFHQNKIPALTGQLKEQCQYLFFGKYLSGLSSNTMDRILND